jgi:hypothetical protein
VIGTRTIVRVCIGATSLVALASCTSLPDTSGYTEATFDLKQSTVAAGSALRSELVRVGEQIPGDQNQAAMRSATDNYDRAWAETVESLAAMGRYAEAVEALTDAGNEGASSARELADKVQALTEAVGVVPGATAVSLATDTVVQINMAIANMRASRSLQQSLAIADPIMLAIGSEVAGQTGIAHQMFVAMISQQRAQLNDAYSDVRDIDTALRAAEVLAAASALQPGAAPETQARLTRLRDARVVLAPRFSEYEEKRAALDARARAGNDLFVATQAAVSTWADSHNRLVVAVRERRPVSFESLLAASQDIRGLVQRWRDL